MSQQTETAIEPQAPIEWGRWTAPGYADVCAKCSDLIRTRGWRLWFPYHNVYICPACAGATRKERLAA